VTGFLDQLDERVKTLAGDWTKYTVIASFVLYLVGYLALRFHLTAIGIGTDLAVLDERYLFTGARFFVYLVATVPALVLVALPFAALAWLLHRFAPMRLRAAVCTQILRPSRLLLLGIVFAVAMIQFVMRQCFVLNDLLLARTLPSEPAWLISILFNEMLAPLYFSVLVAACIVTLTILWFTRELFSQNPNPGFAFCSGLLAFLAGVQILLLPINYGVLIVDKSLPRVAALGARPLADGDEAWLVWEGKDSVTFLTRNAQRTERVLISLPKSEVKEIRITGFDRIVPTLFGTQPGSKG